jgi:hypothetical protein
LQVKEAKMYSLIKTDKTVKIEPASLVDLYKYVKCYINWNTDELIKKLNEIHPYRKLPEYSKRVKFIDDNVISIGANVHIPLESLLLPSYIYNRISKEIIDFTKPKRGEKVSIDNLSLLDIYQVVPDPKGKFESVNLGISIRYRVSRGYYWIDAVWISFENKRSGKSRRSSVDSSIGMFFFDMFEEELDLGEYIKTMRQLDGTSYSKLGENVLRGILNVERSLILVINLFNVLHSYEFNENDVIDSLFKKHSDNIKGFGDKLEDVIAPVKVALAFL